MLKNITVTDFLQEGKTLSWDLHPEVNILWGENGSGKSYLLDLIENEAVDITWADKPCTIRVISKDKDDYLGLFNNYKLGLPFSDKLPFSGISNLSEGQHRLYYIYGIATKYKDQAYTLLIDDIELHLHIDNQRTIIKQLREINPNCQLIVTTHSPSILMGYMSEGSNIEDLLT
jgi:predicted ATP-binding protein involved in virulence